MDDFLGMYMFFVILAAAGFFLFWGIVIYLVVRFFKADTGMSTEEKVGWLALAMQAFSAGSAGRGAGGPGPVETEIRGMAAREGIDLNK